MTKYNVREHSLAKPFIIKPTCIEVKDPITGISKFFPRLQVDCGDGREYNCKIGHRIKWEFNTFEEASKRAIHAFEMLALDLERFVDSLEEHGIEAN